MCSGSSLTFPKTLFLSLFLVFFHFTINFSLYLGYSEHVLGSFEWKQNTSMILEISDFLPAMGPFPPPPFTFSPSVHILAVLAQLLWWWLQDFSWGGGISFFLGYFLGFRDSTLAWSFPCLIGCCFSFPYSDAPPVSNSKCWFISGLAPRSSTPLYSISFYICSTLNQFYWESTRCQTTLGTGNKAMSPQSSCFIKHTFWWKRRKQTTTK